MDSTPFLFLLLILFFTGSAFLPVNASSEDDFQLCESVVNKWATSQLNHEFKEDKHTLRDLLFFLHIPRTGGRTYFRCFLKKLYSTQLCPPSYDKLWFNPRKANCRLLVTHDDYSIMSTLPKEKTSVVTILRNPVDRVFSTYEFSIEEAARFLVHPNLTSSNAVSTQDIWPWKYLVPWMREDLFARRDARLLKKQNHVGHNDSYEMGDMAMPLHQYINDPIALDIVHNGATFQIAGLTNNSYMAESHEVRACIRKHPALGDSVLDVAKRRLDHMLYVGVTEDHKESATVFAHVVGAQVISQLVGSNSSMGHLATNLTGQVHIAKIRKKCGMLWNVILLVCDWNAYIKFAHTWAAQRIRQDKGSNYIYCIVVSRLQPRHASRLCKAGTAGVAADEMMGILLRMAMMMMAAARTIFGATGGE